MAHEVIYESGKRKQKPAKPGKAADHLENGEQATGWEEELWMNQASISAEEAASEWETDNAPADVPSFDSFKEQLGKVRGQMENGLYSLLNGTQFRQAATASLAGATDVLSDPRNSEELKRWSSLVGGGLLALFGLRRSLGNLVLMGIGGGLVYYALTGKWPLPATTTPSRLSAVPTGRTGATSLDSKRPMTVKNILVKAQLKDVYAAWANFENFPQFMQHIRSVTKTGDQTSHWVMDGPFHSRLEWDAEVTRQEENKRIAWSSTEGDITTSGQVTFNALPDDYVEVTVMLRYVPPAGIAGDLFATFFADPEGKLAEDLRNFKRYVEKSESATQADNKK